MVSNIAIIGSVVVSALGAIFGLYQARKADKSATTTRTIEIGVKDLVDQYQEANRELREQVHECNQSCLALKEEVASLKLEVASLKEESGRKDAIIDNKDADIIRLKRQLGEPV